MVAFVQQRVLHLYGVRESFVERLMCSAKRHNKIKTKHRSTKEARKGAGQGINPEINQTAGCGRIEVRPAAILHGSTRIICIRYFIGLDPDNFVVFSVLRRVRGDGIFTSRATSLSCTRFKRYRYRDLNRSTLSEVVYY